MQRSGGEGGQKVRRKAQKKRVSVRRSREQFDHLKRERDDALDQLRPTQKSFASSRLHRAN